MTELQPKTPAGSRSPQGEPPSRMRQALSIALEAVVSLSLALGCFLVFLWVLDTVFPSSVGFRRQLALQDGHRSATWGREAAPDGPRPAAAVLRVISNDVRHRKLDQIAWGSARQNGSVFEGDAIQTTRDGQAALRFADGRSLRVGRNSLLVVRTPEERARGQGSFMVGRGELWGTAPESDDPERDVTVNTPSATVLVRTAQGSSKRADFKVSVGPDRSSIIAVYHGSASITTGNQTQEVRENHFVAVDSLGTQSMPSKLPDPPTLVGPREGARFLYRDPPPRFAFEWETVADADAYRLVVARDAAFQSVVLDRRMSSSSLDYGRLATGDYVWRVSSIRDEVEGRPSPIRSLHMVRDGAPPRLEVKFPEVVMTSDECTITGVSEADSRVFVAGRPATVTSNGTFSCRVRLKRGLNVVVVEALDPTGNAAYASKMVEARY
jgi:hypothetical protein